jgi:hypothetical protein
MLRVTLSARFRRSRFRVFAAALLATAQFAVSAFAPAVDSKAGTSAPVHVEAFGVALHFAHNPDDCAACTAITLIGVTSPAAPPLAERTATAMAFAVLPPEGVARTSWRPDSPRAPPALSSARSIS